MALWLFGSLILLAGSARVVADPQSTVSASSPLGGFVLALVDLGAVLRGRPAAEGLWLAASACALSLLLLGRGRGREWRPYRGPALLACAVCWGVLAQDLVWRSPGAASWIALAVTVAMGMCIPVRREIGPRPGAAPDPGPSGMAPWLLAAALLAGVALRFALLDEVPYGYAGHAAYHALESERLLQQILEGSYAGANGVLSGFFRFLFGFGQSVQRVLDMVAFGLFGFGFLQQRVTAASIGVLSIALLYVTGTRLFGARCGAVAAFLLAVSPWHVTWSRYEGSMQIQSIPFVLIAVLLALRATDRGAWWRFALTGLWSGLAVLLYAPNLLVPAVLLLFLAHWAITGRPAGAGKTRWRALAWFAAGAGAIAFLRLRHTGWVLENILDTPLPHGASAGAEGLGERFGTFLVQFFVHPSGVLISRDGPLLNPVVSACFLIGLGMALRRLPERPFFLVVLLVGAGLLPAVLSDGPYPRRFFNMIPAVYLLAAFTVDRWLAGFPRPPGKVLRAAALPAACAALLLLTGVNAAVYFQTVRAPESDLSALNRAAAEEVRDRYYGRARIYNVSSALNRAHAQAICHGLEAAPDDFAYWFREAAPEELLEILRNPADAGGEPVLILLPAREPLLPEIRRVLAERVPRVEERRVPERPGPYGQLEANYLPGGLGAGGRAGSEDP